MKKIYYNSTRVEILKRLKYLNEQKYVDFFRESTPFMLALYITYFGLAEDIMIEKDSKDYNINTRYTKYIDDKYLKKVFPSNIPIKYTKKEKDGNSMEWILSTLRNALFHNGVEVNYKDKEIIAKNEGFLNNLECTIPFEWFENFINNDIIKHIELDNYTYHIFIPPFKTKNIKWIQNYEQLNEYIDKELHSIVININYNENSNNKTKIEREEFISFNNEISTKVYQLFYREKNEIINNEFELLKEKIEKETLTKKTTLSNTEYEKLIYFKIFKEYYTNQFTKKYPNYNLSITKFENNNYAKSLFKRGKDRIQFFKRELPQFQGKEIANILSKRFNHDKIQYLSKIYELCSLYSFCCKMITPEYQTDKFMEKAINPYKYNDYRRLEEEYIDYIKKELKRKKISQSYDKQITKEIISEMSFFNDNNNSIHLRCRELTNNYKGNINSKEYEDYIKDNLKKEFPSYYEDMNKEYAEHDINSDQVLEIFYQHNIYAINNARGILMRYKDDIIETLLYTLGINTYVMNKETNFKDFDEKDYNFMDTLYFKGYSNDLYRNDIEIAKQKRSELKSKQKKINTTLNGLQIGITKSKSSIDLQKKKQDIIDQQSNLNTITSLIANYDTKIKSTEVIEIDKIKLQRASNVLCANIIRNCFAHCDRVHITGRDKKGEILITLTDYDNNGKISGIVETNLTSLISFLSNDIFKKEMNKNNILKKK